MKYEVIFFDADETLFDFKKGERFAFLSTLDEMKIELDKEECMKLYSEINRKIWLEFEEGTITLESLKVERFNRFLNELKIEGDGEAFSKSFVKYLGQASFIFDETKELLEYLQGKYRLAIITNGITEVQKSRFAKSGIDHYFEALIISDEVKISKPDSRIFDYALNTINHNEKSTVLMIGDSLTSDIRGGNNSKIDTCWINWGKKKNTSDIKPTYEVNSLFELKDLI